MTFNDLKVGDNIYIVNNSPEFGLRIETHTVKEINEQIDFFIFNLENKECFYVEKFQMKDESLGVYFLDLAKAEDYFLEKYIDVYRNFVNEASEYMKKYEEKMSVAGQMIMLKNLIEEKRNKN